MKGNLWTVVLIACALALLVPIVNGGYADAATTEVANETATVDYDQAYSLGQSPADVYEYGSFDVDANGTNLTRGTDYLVNETSGQLDWLNTTATTDGDTAAVNYSYSAHDQQTTIQADILQTVGSWIGLLVMLFGLGYIIVLMGGGSY